MRVAMHVVSALWAFLVGSLALALFLGAGTLRQALPMQLGVAVGLLVGLPMVVSAIALRGGPAGLAGASAWPLMLVIGFPVFFPDERALALHTGISALLLPLGLAVEPALATRLDDALPALTSGRVPPPSAEPMVEPAAAEPEAHIDGDQVALPFEGEGRTLSIPVTVEGPGDRARDVWMLFDTGATLTTLDTATLASVGVTVPEDAPEVTVHTAGGDRRTRLALLERVWIGGLEVDGVTVSVCDACAGEHAVGLLGLNVSGRFLATVDHAHQELLLEPQPGRDDRSLDVGHWLELGATATRWPDGRMEVQVRARNRSARPVSHADVAIACDRDWVAGLDDIAPGSSADTVVSLPAGSRCDGYTVRLAGASW